MKTTVIYPQTSINVNVPRINTEQVREQLKPAKIYRKQLKMYRRMARFIDRHPVLTNLWIGIWSVAGFLIILFY